MERQDLPGIQTARCDQETIAVIITYAFSLVCFFARQDDLTQHLAPLEKGCWVLYIWYVQSAAMPLCACH